MIVAGSTSYGVSAMEADILWKGRPACFEHGDKSGQGFVDRTDLTCIGELPLGFYGCLL